MLHCYCDLNKVSFVFTTFSFSMTLEFSYQIIIGSCKVQPCSVENVGPIRKILLPNDKIKS